MTTKRWKPLFERLKQGLKEGIAHVQGELTLRTVEVPEEPPEIDAKSLAALRTQAAMSQAVFAKLLNVSTKTLQSWKQGVRQPSDVSRRLIQSVPRRARHALSNRRAAGGHPEARPCQASKEQIIFMVRAMLQLKISPSSSHSADALALALTHLASRRVRDFAGLSRRK